MQSSNKRFLSRVSTNGWESPNNPTEKWQTTRRGPSPKRKSRRPTTCVKVLMSSPSGENANLEPQWDTTTHPQIGCTTDNINCGQELQSAAAEGVSWYDCWVKSLGSVWWRLHMSCDHTIPPWDRCLTEMRASGAQRNIPRMSEAAKLKGTQMYINWELEK